MTVLHTGWTKKFGANWDSIFAGKRKATSAKTAKAPARKKKAAKKKSSKAKR
jgi:hypothetical protein